MDLASKKAVIFALDRFLIRTASAFSNHHYSLWIKITFPCSFPRTSLTTARYFFTVGDKCTSSPSNSRALRKFPSKIIVCQRPACRFLSDHPFQLHNQRIKQNGRLSIFSFCQKPLFSGPSLSMGVNYGERGDSLAPPLLAVASNWSSQS